MEKLQKCWSCSSSYNPRTRTGWRWLKMLHKLNRPPIMDLPSEIIILSLKILPSNQHGKPSLHMHTENNAVTEGKCAVDGIESVFQVPKSEIFSESFCIDLPKEIGLPPLKNKPRNGVVEPPLQHPATQRYTSAEIML